MTSISSSASNVTPEHSSHTRRTAGDLPSAEEFAYQHHRRAWTLRIGVVLGSLLMVFLFTSYQWDALYFPLAVLFLAIAPVLFWNWPETMLWVILGGVCLFELLPSRHPDEITGVVPFFWNVNSIFQNYFGQDMKAIPFNVVECLFIIGGVTSLIKNVYAKTLNIRIGPLILPFLVYIGFVLIGWLNGMATGGNFKISLQEVRSQFCFCLAYLVASSIVKTRRQLTTLCWITITCIGLKGILYTFRRYVTMAGLPLPDQGVGSHEEAFFLDTLIVLLINLGLTRAEPNMQKAIWFLLPTTILGQLACNRRAGIAAFIILLPLLFLAAAVALPERRRFIIISSIAFGIIWSIYYPTFKNKDSMFALPARAVKSQFSPDPRDASSNAYRDAENADQMATIELSPIIGYGYGKRFLHVVPIADISINYEWWDIIPHNQILWVWMRVGTLGFFAFWMLIASILVRACRLLRRTNIDPLENAMVFHAFSVVIMLIVFGLLDMQISNQRDMLFVGILAGTICSSLYPKDPEQSEELVSQTVGNSRNSLT